MPPHLVSLSASGPSGQSEKATCSETARRQSAWLAVLPLLWATGCAPGHRAAGTLPVPQRTCEIRYLALGDSYTIGEGVAASDRWPVQLAARLRARGIPIAEPEMVARTGWTTDELDRGIDQASPQGPCQPVRDPGRRGSLRRRDARLA